MFGWNNSILQGELAFPIEEVLIPQQVTLLLKQGYGQAVFPLVKEGEKVQAGQVIGAGEQVGSPVHSTINGKIVSFIEAKNHLGESVPAVVIEGTDEADFVCLAKFSPRYYKKRPEDIRNLIYRSGASALGEKGIPTQFKSSSVPLEKTKAVVVNGVNASPFTDKNEFLIKPRLYQFITGLKILQFALNVPVYFAMNKQDDEIFHFLKSEQGKNKWLKLMTLRPKQPISTSVLAEEFVFTSGSKNKRKELNDGAIYLEAADILHIYEAVIEGKPLIDRFIAMGGNGFLRNSILRVRIGSSLQEVVASQIKKELNIGVKYKNLMVKAGSEALDIPVDKATSEIMASIEVSQNGKSHHF